ncbi:MAG TPA: acetyltransferase [Archangium sp.]|uniref:esterase/lipase family protein n=1 Tax=Archangium sp. TaxID=1872627 RepID=UPI002E325016|nr:acetyltransferase [Archangium sp.]HEX5751213.1 acetyltransferase [Archangium sp.]
MKKLHTLVMALCALGLTTQAHAGAAKTTYPVVFAHGMAGFDDILGYDYWGDDYGMFVGDTCGLFEVPCNEDLASGQKSFVGQVQPFQNSEVRGLDLANDIEGYMASSGATRVNLIGHSQGGMDARKAAKVLYTRKGYTVVSVLVSVSSPHRGSPVAKYILDLKPGVTSVVSALAEFFGNVVYQPGNDAFAGAKQLVYNDYSSTDGLTTGAKTFNVNNPIDARYASRYVSLITAQNGVNVNPALWLLNEFIFDIDGDGYCLEDCDNDGAAGKGDGIANESDDDGVVGINSQQMGYRLKYTEYALGFDYVGTDANVPYMGNINTPSASSQMTSTSSVITQDHLDVIGVGPDTFDEPEFYAAIIDYIAYFD